MTETDRFFRLADGRI